MVGVQDFSRDCGCPGLLRVSSTSSTKWWVSRTSRQWRVSRASRPVLPHAGLAPRRRVGAAQSMCSLLPLAHGRRSLRRLVRPPLGNPGARIRSRRAKRLLGTARQAASRDPRSACARCRGSTSRGDARACRQSAAGFDDTQAGAGEGGWGAKGRAIRVCRGTPARWLRAGHITLPGPQPSTAVPNTSLRFIDLSRPRASPGARSGLVYR